MKSEQTGWRSHTVAQEYSTQVSDPDKDNHIRKNVLHDPIFYKLLNDLNNQTVLELGAGNMYMAGHIRAQHPGIKRYIATDFPHMLAHGAQVNEMKVASTARRIPLKDNSVDTVFASFLYHWVKEKQESFKEVYRVLKPEGRFIFSIIHSHFYKTGKVTDINGKKSFISTVDPMLSREFKVMLSKTIGPLTYYGTSWAEYPNMLLQAGFKSPSMQVHWTTNSQVEKHPELEPYLYKRFAAFFVSTK